MYNKARYLVREYSYTCILTAAAAVVVPVLDYIPPRGHDETPPGGGIHEPVKARSACSKILRTLYDRGAPPYIQKMQQLYRYTTNSSSATHQQPLLILYLRTWYISFVRTYIPVVSVVRRRKDRSIRYLTWCVHKIPCCAVRTYR